MRAEVFLAPDSMLLKEIGEHHAYIRHFFDLYVKWFTFFLTVLITPYSWVVSKKNSEPVQVAPLAIFFLAQIALGIITCGVVLNHFLQQDTLLQQLYVASHSQLQDSTAIPICVMTYASILMMATLATNAAMWIFFWWKHG
jgi:hypothetical protein